VHNTVAIVGSHPKTRLDFDFTRTDCDIWVFNEALSNPKETWCPRADAVFQMHVPTIWRNPKNRNDPAHADWLRTQTETPVYMQEQYEDVPMSRRYPIEAVCAGVNFNKRYFTSSVAYALALASYCEYSRVELYGVEMETDTEYRYQRDGVTFWIGVCLGKGKEVIAHCGMFESPLYGYEGDVRLSYSVFTDSIAEITAKLPAIEQKYNERRKATAELIKQFGATGRDGEKIVKAVQEQLGAGIEYGTLDGAKQENERYLKKADTMIQANGDFVFSRQEFETAKQALQKKQIELMTKTNVLAGQTETAFRACEKVTNLFKRRRRVSGFVVKLDEYIKSTVTTSMIIGALNENQKFLNRLDLLIRAAGGAKSEAVLMEALNESRA
jgi:hypothetical protein